MRAAEAWARAKGFKEFASDTQLAHVAMGFMEVERVVAYRKAL